MQGIVRTSYMHIGIDGPAIEYKDLFLEEHIEVSPGEELRGDPSTGNRLDLGFPVAFETDDEAHPVRVTGAQSRHAGVGQVDQQAVASPGRIDLQMPAVMLPSGAKMVVHGRPTADGEDFMDLERGVRAGPGELLAQGIPDPDGGGIDDVPVLDLPKHPRQIDLLRASIGQGPVGQGGHELLQRLVKPAIEGRASHPRDLTFQVRSQDIGLVGATRCPGRDHHGPYEHPELQLALPFNHPTLHAQLECPLIVDTDVDTSFCKALKETQLARPEPSSGALRASVRRQLPYGMHDLTGPEHQLDGWARVVGRPPVLGHGGDPALRRVVDPGLGHQQVISVLEPYHLIVAQDRDGLPPEAPIHIGPEVVRANLPMRAHLARQLAEPEDPPEAARFAEASPGIGQEDFRRDVVESPLSVLPFMGPMAPALIVLHELGMLPRHRCPIGAACPIRIEPPALDREAPCGEVLPGMALGDRGPLDRQRRETGLQGHKHRPMVTDDRLRRPHWAMACRKT
jgi:hypothetical protein